MRAPWLPILHAAAVALVSNAALAQQAPPAPEGDEATPQAPPGQAPGDAPPPPAPPASRPASPPPQPYTEQPAAQPYPPQQPPPAQQPYAQPAPPPQGQPAPQPYAPQPSPPQAQPQPQVPPPPPPQRFEGQVSGGYGSPSYPDQGGEAGASGGGKGWSPTGFSVRLDPLNWLIRGRLGFELELGLLSWLTVEMIPILVANEEPPSFNLRGRADTVRQESNGIGPFSGASLGVGFWLGGEAFRGYVLRAILTNYGYSYVAQDSGGVFDRVDHTERNFVAFFGSYSRWGLFTIGGGLELGYEMNQQERCDLVPAGGDRFASESSGCQGELRIAIERGRSPDQRDLNSSLHPVTLGFRFSLGLAFD